MAIEFSCSQCGRQLRTPDGSEGRRAKCPQCGAVVTVPSPTPPQIDTGETFAPPTESEDVENPFAAPRYADAGYESPSLDESERTGPPWERRSSVRSYIATIKLVYTEPDRMFRTMRRNGGIGAPFLFSMIGPLLSTAVTVAFMLLVFAGGPIGAIESGVILILAVLSPLLIAILVFISSALLHLGVMIAGGSRFGYETTFRIYAYSFGAISLLNIPASIPLVGIVVGLVALVLWIVYTVIGLMRAHEISGGRAVLSLVIGVLSGCACWMGTFMLIFLFFTFAA